MSVSVKFSYDLNPIVNGVEYFIPDEVFTSKANVLTQGTYEFDDGVRVSVSNRYMGIECDTFIEVEVDGQKFVNNSLANRLIKDRDNGINIIKFNTIPSGYATASAMVYPKDM